MNKLTINKDFAKKYNQYRKKEEHQKLKDRYGDDLSESSSDESEDDLAEVITPKLQKDFFNTLAALKRKDSKIYDKEATFFQNPTENGESSKKKKEKPLLLGDYERKVILEKDGHYEDEETNKKNLLSHVEELEKIKSDFKAVADEECDADEDFFTKSKTENEEGDKKTKTEVLEDLDDYWKSDELSEKEKFLRDYILEEKYVVDNDELYESDDQDDDNEFLERQQVFEEAFNHRFEEPDKDFIKSYPRKITNSVRNVENKKKVKRAEKRKAQEEAKKKRQEEIKRLKNLKREEILEKLEKLKKAAGAEDVDFDEGDIGEDFDADKHDQRMKDLFNEEFYQEADEEKPEFSDDDYGEFDYDEEDWDTYVPANNLPDCEQPDFVMDADYEQNKQKSKKEAPKKGKKSKKSPFYSALEKEKPLFDPKEKTFDEYLEEYYALDCEDFINGEPTRFKYRSVPCNDFGLTTEEILSSDNRTLNAWCSIKKVVQQRTEVEEDKMIKRFQKKSKYGKAKHFQTYQPQHASSSKNVSKDKKKRKSKPSDEPKNKKQKLSDKKGKKKKNNDKKEGQLERNRLAAYGL